MTAIPSFRVAGGVLSALILFLLPQALHATPPDEVTAWLRMQQQGGDEVRTAEQKFWSGFETLYSGPQWLLDVLPTASPLARPRTSTFVFDRSGDRIEVAAYATPPRDDFDVRFFNNVPFLPAAGISSPAAPSALTVIKQFDGNGSIGGSWGFAPNWSPDGVPTSSDDVVFNNAFRNPLQNVHLSGSSQVANSLNLELTTNQAWALGANDNSGGGAISLAATLTLTTGVIKRSDTTNNSVNNIGASGTGSLVGVTTLATTAGGFLITNDDTNGTLQIDATISGANKFVSVDGDGTVVFGGPNTYTGFTDAHDGATLLINGDQSMATGAVTAQTIGTLLGGTGTIGGAVTVFQGASITGGGQGTVGALTLNSSLTFSASTGTGGTYLVDFSGGTSDLLAIAGLLDLSGSFDELFLNNSPNGTHSYVLATYGSIIGEFDVTNIPANYELIYGSHSLTLAPIPEPSTWIGATLTLAAIGWTQRKRFTKRA